MEVIDELDDSTKPSKVREEGELSSDDEHMVSPPQEDHVLSSSQCNSSIDRASGLVPVSPVNNCSEDVQVGKSGNNPTIAVDVQSQAHRQPISQKSFDKNRIPSKANIPQRCAPIGASDNLVIRFSDDSSGSDSEEKVKEKAAESKSNVPGVAGVRKPPANSIAKLNKQNTTTTAITKVIPQKYSFNRAFTLTTATKALVSNSSGGGGVLPVEQGPRVKNVNTLSKNMPNRERWPDRSVDLNNTKLQDLRQQIALRESELKLKSLQRSKESFPLRDDDSATWLQHSNANANVNKKYSATSSTSTQKESTEPDKKRKKVGGSFSFGSPEDLVGTTIVPSKEPAGQKNITPVSDFDRRESSIDNWHKKNVSENIPAGLNCDATTAIVNRVPSDGNSSDTLNQATSLANINSQASPMNMNVAEINPVNTQPPTSISNRGTRGKDLLSKKTLEPPFGDVCQESESLWNRSRTANVSEYRSTNMQSLADMEESLDKDLEDAQELRRRCEIEERNALKAYRKAQRALVEANAKCADLYHKREMYSAQLRSLIMSDSSFLCSSIQNEKIGIGYSNDVSGDMLLLPSSHPPLQPEFDRFNHPLERDLNIQKSHQHVNGQTMGSESFCEPDASTSYPLSHRDKVSADGFCSPSNDQNISAGEGNELFSFENEAGKDKNLDNDENNLRKEPSKKLMIEKPPEDSFLLEATLRSQLFARLGRRTYLKNSASSDNIHRTVEQGTENDVDKEKMEANLEKCLMSKEESERGGPNEREQSDSEAHMEMQDDFSMETGCLNSRGTIDPGNDGIPEKGFSILISDVSTSNIFRSAFNHLKIVSPKTLMEWVSKNRHNYSDIDNNIVFDKFNCNTPTVVSTCEKNVEFCGSKVGSYTCNIEVDPCWPLCMYELRGKCNNDECPWQHIRDNNKAIVSCDQRCDSDGDAKVRRYHDVTASPSTYLVALDTLRVDVPSYESVLGWRTGQCWQKCFSLSLTATNFFQRDLGVHGTLSCGSDGRIEVHKSWSRQSLDFLRRNDRLASDQLKQSVADNEQSLETALLIFTQEVDELEGMKKALPVLSRTLEDNPTSVFLWIFYLLICHSNVKSVVVDDMFSYAVKYNEGSYELWLMYINTRMHLDDRLITYDAALRALCRHASTSNRDEIHSSACILDLFLQMIKCLCISGNVEKAIQKVLEVCSSSDTNTDKHHPLALSDMHSRLTISDKCMFWVCCVYLVIYRKLPDVVVRQFECDKTLSDIEWPLVVLLDDEKHKAVELMEKGLDYVTSLMQSESLKSDTGLLNSAQFLAVNHIRCMVAIESSERGWALLGKYLRIYPSCLELVLMSTQAHKQEFGDASFLGFEEILSNWPKQIPGIQCIWNQYAQLSLQNGLYEFGKELMDRWYISAWKEHESGLPESAPDSTFESPLSLDLVDLVFGFLNLSLYKLLQNDRFGARIAVDKALKASTPKYLKYCIREHVMFFLTDESLMKDNASSTGGIIHILKHHIGDSHVFSFPEPLPRKFIANFKRLRVQQLVNNIFSPISPDFSLVNLVLEVWFGPTLLPEEFKEPKDLVDFVECILDMWPSNYELALSVCKLVNSRKNYADDDTNLTGMLFWASSNLVSTLYHAVPIPPEYVWLESGRILGGCGEAIAVDDLSQRFYRRALTVYPFSVNLWRSYQIFYVKMGGHAKTIVEEAKAKGIDLG